MNWDEWAANLFNSCVDGIKTTDPEKHPLEWKLYWELLVHFKKFQEEKSKDSAESE